LPPTAVTNPWRGAPWPRNLPGMRGIFFGVAAALVLSACSSGTPAAPSSTSTTVPSTPGAAPVTTSARAASPLSPNGFGAHPPTRAQLLAYVDWSKGPGTGALRAIEDIGKGIAQVGEASKGVTDAHDLQNRLASGCRTITNALTIRMPASLPTPDPDMTNVLQFLIDDGKALESACNAAMSDPPTEAQLLAVPEALYPIITDLETHATIRLRNADLMYAEGKR
jgi:hypothetical protein